MKSNEICALSDPWFSESEFLDLCRRVYAAGLRRAEPSTDFLAELALDPEPVLWGDDQDFARGVVEEMAIALYLLGKDRDRLIDIRVCDRSTAQFFPSQLDQAGKLI